MEGRHPLDIDDLVVGLLANLQMPTGDVPALMRDLALLDELDGTQAWWAGVVGGQDRKGFCGRRRPQLLPPTQP